MSIIRNVRYTKCPLYEMSVYEMSVYEMSGNQLCPQSVDSNRADDIDLTLYSSIFTIENLVPNSETRQVLAFIGGDAAFSLLKKLSKGKSLCLDCTSVSRLLQNIFI